MKTKSKRNPVEETIAIEIPEAIARMDQAYRETTEGFPTVEADWEFVLLGLRSEIVEQVEALLESQGLTRADLARRLGTSRANVSKMLNETTNFQLETVAKLAVALDRDIALRFLHKAERIRVEKAVPARTAVAESTENKTARRKTNPKRHPVPPSSSCQTQKRATTAENDDETPRKSAAKAPLRVASR